jgi:hypothetical protein
MGIDDVAHELYGLVPEEFTAARNARVKEAKAAGDPELAAAVQALRKPTTGAWLLNQLVRRHGDEVEQVLELGGQLRAAQGTLGAAELRELDRQRRQLTHAVAQQARTLGRDAGRRVTESVVTEVEETLRSAMVDAEAGAALSTGLLTDTFSSTGIEPVDLSRVLALGGPAPRRVASSTASARDGQQATREAKEEEPDAEREQELAEARTAVAQAEAARRSAQERAAQASERAAQARQLREQLEGERDELRGRLETLEEQLSEAVAVEETASQARDEASTDEASAADAVEAAERLLGRLEPRA